MAKRPPLPPEILKRMNREYAVVIEDGHFLVIRRSDNVTFKKSEFRDALGNEFFIHDGEECSIPEAWLRSPKRAQYKGGQVFDPGRAPSYDEGECHLDTYNLWRGFSVVPIQGDVLPGLDFICDICCDGISELQEYLLDWIANLVQLPANRPGTGIVLSGPQGAGKSFFARMLMQLTAPYSVEFNDPQLLTGRFGEQLGEKILIVADEVAFTDVKAAEKLKNIITNEDQTIEKKFRPPMKQKIHARIVNTTNQSHAIHAQRDERRYLVLCASDRRREDTDYFGRLDDWLQNGGINALMHYFLNREIKSNLRIVPKTRALLDQKIDSLNPIESAWFELLSKGRLPHADGWPSWIEAEALHAILGGSNSHSAGHGAHTRIGRLLRKMAPSIRRERRTVLGRQEWCYVLAPLDVSRIEFQAYLRTNEGLWDSEPPPHTDPTAPAPPG
jgi:hypothetical protein